jgi:hypothetical protein
MNWLWYFCRTIIVGIKYQLCLAMVIKIIVSCVVSQKSLTLVVTLNFNARSNAQYELELFFTRLIIFEQTLMKLLLSYICVLVIHDCSNAGALPFNKHIVSTWSGCDVEIKTTIK